MNARTSNRWFSPTSRTLVAAGFTLAVLAAQTTFAQARQLMSTEQSGTKATVMILDGVATVHLAAPGATPRVIDLGTGWKAVTAVRFAPNMARLAIVARAASQQVSIVDVQGARLIATYPVIAAALAPDGRAVVLEHVRDTTSGDPPRFLLIALSAPADPIHERPTILKDPGIGGTAVRHSDFQWIDPEVVAFVARTGNDVSLAAFQVNAAGEIQKQGVKPLGVNDLVNVSTLAAGASAAAVVAGAQIARVPTAGLTLRLQFPANPTLRLRTTDVTVW